MTTQHTPTPWKADKWATGYTISAPDSHYSVCHLAGCNNEEANANHIVKCVNAHNDLVKTAELLQKACGIQANLLSTATEEEKNEFISIIFSICNGIGLSAITKAKE